MENKRLRGQLLNADFEDFKTSAPVDVPETVSSAIFSQVRSELNPPASSVFMKVSLIQLLVGFATLALCPQFGISLTSRMGLMHYLMKYGESVCMLGCGALFLGTSLLAASFVLRPEEVKVLRKNRILQLVSLATLSLGAFVCIGADVVLSLGMIWALGAIVGGAGSLQIGWYLRRRVSGVA